jgi:hypothetical protein
MHGIIFAELEKFVTQAQGADQWQEVLAHANLPARVYMAVGSYPDADLMKLVQGASVVTQRPAADLLEGFGEFITPTLFSMYRTVINPAWRTLDLVENTESVIHKVVRTRGGTPPVLAVQRQDATHLVVTYGSKRKLCALARGIILGIAKHYRETVSITQPSCMLDGAKTCRLEVALVVGRAVKSV